MSGEAPPFFRYKNPTTFIFYRRLQLGGGSPLPPTPLSEIRGGVPPGFLQSHYSEGFCPGAYSINILVIIAGNKRISHYITII